MAIEPLSLSMVGIIVLAPVIANVLKPVVVPLFSFLGADPAMLAGSILANDMGGAPLARELALSEDAANFAGLIVSAMLGVTIVFTIPVSLSVVILAGAYPLMYVITKVFKKPLLQFGKLLGINEVAAAGMVVSLANSIPMFGTIKDMDNRGKVVNMAFAVSAAFVFGDHLGFTAGFNSNMIFSMVIGKLVGGITAVAVAIFMTRNMRRDLE